MKIIKSRTTINDLVFYVAWFLFSSTLILMSAIFYVNNTSLELILKMVRYIAYVLCVVRIICGQYRKQELLFSIFLVITFILSGVGTGNMTYPLYCFIVLASIKMKSEKIVKATAYIQILYLAGIAFLSQTGIVLDYIFDASGRARHGLGFSWTTTPPILFFYLTLCIVYVRRNKLSLGMLFTLEIINTWFLYMTDSKMAFAMCTLVILVATFEKKNKHRWKWLSKYNGIFVAFPFLMFLLTLVIIKIYDENIATWAAIDKVLSHRLGLSQSAYNTYGIHLLGQPIKWVGYDYKATLSVVTDPYNYVDSSYLQIAFNNGLIFLIVVLLLYSYGIYKATQNGDYALVLIYMAVLIIALTEPRLMNFAYNPFPLLALSSLSADIRNIKYMKKKRLTSLIN